MNYYDNIKLEIYEAYDNGEISYDEKEYLLEEANDAEYNDYYYEADAYVKNDNRLVDLIEPKTRDEIQEKRKRIKDRLGRYEVVTPYRKGEHSKQFSNDPSINPKGYKGWIPNDYMWYRNKSKERMMSDKLANKEPNKHYADMNKSVKDFMNDFGISREKAIKLHIEVNKYMADGFDKRDAIDLAKTKLRIRD